MKLTPQELEFENAVLGACILDANAFSRVSSLLKSEHFYLPDNARMFDCFYKLTSENKPIDFLTVDALYKDTTRLMKLTAKVSSSANIEYHAATIYEKFIARELINTCQSALERVYDTTDIFELQNEVMMRLESKVSLKSKEPIEFNPLIIETIKKIESIQANDKHITGIDTSFRDLNELTNGWHAPDLTIIAARPATGKTAFALNIALEVAKQNIPVAFFSLEMSAQQLAYRAIPILSGVYSNYVKKSNLNERNWQDIMNVNYNLPIFIDDTPGLNLLDFKDKCRKLKRNKKVKMVIVDYLQLINANVKGNREQEISTISRTLKHMAKELDVCMIALAQLSRDVEKRGGSPRLSDLRESGSIEQDADNVIFLHDEIGDDMIQNINLDVIFAKHRNGETGRIQLNFDKGKQKFNDI
jgi:replicative DNA helicase